jgi:phosphatidylglycerophosphatase A
MNRLIVTFFGAGLLRPLAGTWGSLAALPVAWVIARYLGPWALVAGIVVVTVVGWYAVRAELPKMDDGDHGEFVIDEVAGQWIALLPVVFGAAHAGADLLALWPGWVAAFVLFRLFDTTKLGPIGWADRMHGHTGVMLDDLIAGVAAAIGVMILAALWHGM